MEVQDVHEVINKAQEEAFDSLREQVRAQGRRSLRVMCC